MSDRDVENGQCVGSPGGYISKTVQFYYVLFYPLGTAAKCHTPLQCSIDKAECKPRP